MELHSIRVLDIIAWLVLVFGFTAAIIILVIWGTVPSYSETFLTKIPYPLIIVLSFAVFFHGIVVWAFLEVICLIAEDVDAISRNTERKAIIEEEREFATNEKFSIEQKEEIGLSVNKKVPIKHLKRKEVNAKELLKLREIEDVITVISLGKNYTIRDKTYTYADLDELRSLRRKLLKSSKKPQTMKRN